MNHPCDAAPTFPAFAVASAQHVEARMSRGDYIESNKYGITECEQGRKTVATSTVIATHGSVRLARLIVRDRVSGDTLTVLAGPGSVTHLIEGLRRALAELDGAPESPVAPAAHAPPAAPAAPAAPPPRTQGNVGGRGAKDDGMRRPGQPRGRTTP